MKHLLFILITTTSLLYIQTFQSDKLIINLSKHQTKRIQLSKDTEELINELNISNDVSTEPILVNLNSTAVILGYINKETNIDIVTSNGEIGHDMGDIIFIKKNENNTFHLQDFNFKINDTAVKDDNNNYYIKGKSIYTQDHNKEIINNHNDIINCTFNYNGSDLHLERLLNMNNTINITKIQTFSFITFGLDEHNGELYSISFSNNNSYIVYNKLHFDMKNIEDFFIIEQISQNNPLNIIVIINYTTKHIQCYIIEITNFITQQYQFHLYDNIQNINLIEHNVFSQIALFTYKTYMISYTNCNSLFMLHNGALSNITMNTTTSNPIQSFVLLEHTIYILYKAYGIVIYTYNNHNNETPNIFQYIKTIKHSNINSIDLYIHPYFSYIYLTLLIEQSNNSINTSWNLIATEIYIELILLNNETNPRVNKIVTAVTHNKGNNVYLMLYTSINNFFFVYINQHSRFISITREGLHHAIPSISSIYNISPYTIDLNQQIQIMKVFSINTNSMKVVLHVLNTNEMYSLTYVYRTEHNVKCVFPKEGEYVLTFMQKSEVCANNYLLSDNTLCQKIMNYNITISSNEDVDIYGVMLICICFVMGIGVASVGVVAFCLDWCKKRKMINVKIPLSDKRKWYLWYVDHKNCQGSVVNENESGNGDSQRNVDSFMSGRKWNDERKQHIKMNSEEFEFRTTSLTNNN